MAKFLSVEKKNEVLHVTLNRPKVRNAFNAEMIQELQQTFQNVESGTRLVILSGSGESFCAGADLEWMKSMSQFSEEENKVDSLELYDMFLSLWNVPVPIVSYVHGHAFGGAVGLLACSDIVAVEANTRLAFSEVKLGLVPAVISDFVRKKLSAPAMHRFFLTGERFSAEQAREIELCHFVGDESACHAFIEKVQSQLLTSGPEAVRSTKALLRKLPESSSTRDLTASVIAAARVGEEGQEGMKSFFEKRKPSWSRS